MNKTHPSHLHQKDFWYRNLKVPRHSEIPSSCSTSCWMFSRQSPVSHDPPWIGIPHQSKHWRTCTAVKKRHKWHKECQDVTQTMSRISDGFPNSFANWVKDQHTVHVSWIWEIADSPLKMFWPQTRCNDAVSGSYPWSLVASPKEEQVVNSGSRVSFRRKIGLLLSIATDKQKHISASGLKVRVRLTLSAMAFYKHFIVFHFQSEFFSSKPAWRPSMGRMQLL